MDADKKMGLVAVGVAVGLQLWMLSEGMYDIAGWSAVIFVIVFIGSTGTGYHK